MRLGIAVVAHHSAAVMDALVTSLVALPRVGVPTPRVCLVDNAPGDDDAALRALTGRLEAAGFSTCLLTPGSNTGYGGGNNLALAQLRRRGCDVFWVLNPDTAVVRADLAGLARVVDPAAPLLMATGLVTEAGVLAGRGSMDLVTTATTNELHGPVRRRQRDFVLGHSLVVTAAAWDVLGGFDERYSLFCEDTDLTARARRAGVVVTDTPHLVVRHDRGHASGATADADTKSLLAFRHATASVLRWNRVHHAAVLPWAVVVRLTWALTLLGRGHGAASRAVLGGVVAGLTGRVPALPGGAR